MNVSGKENIMDYMEYATTKTEDLFELEPTMLLLDELKSRFDNLQHQIDSVCADLDLRNDEIDDLVRQNRDLYATVRELQTQYEVLYHD